MWWYLYVTYGPCSRSYSDVFLGNVTLAVDVNEADVEVETDRPARAGSYTRIRGLWLPSWSIPWAMYRAQLIELQTKGSYVLLIIWNRHGKAQFMISEGPIRISVEDHVYYFVFAASVSKYSALNSQTSYRP